MSVNETIAQKLATIAANSPRVYAAGMAQGKEDESNSFWEIFQDGGSRSHYAYAFAYLGWTDENYSPKYPIAPTSTTGIGHLFDYNVKITDTKVPITAFGSCISAFANASSIRRIVLLIFSGTTTVSSMFTNCRNLEELACEGTLSITGLDLHWSTKLNKSSIESVIGVLDDTTSGLTVTLSLAAVQAAFETSAGANDGNTSAEWIALVATKPNWTISLV